MINKLKKVFEPLEPRVRALESAVFPDGKDDGKWGLKENIFGTYQGDDLWAEGRGLWRRLDALEYFVYGHSGERRPESSPVHERLKDLYDGQSCLWQQKADASSIWDEAQKINQKIRELEETNDRLQRQIQELENLMVKTINACLGK